MSSDTRKRGIGSVLLPRYHVTFVFAYAVVNVTVQESAGLSDEQVTEIAAKVAAEDGVDLAVLDASSIEVEREGEV